MAHVVQHFRIHGSQTCQPVQRGLSPRCSGVDAVPPTYAVLVCSMSRFMIWNFRGTKRYSDEQARAEKRGAGCTGDDDWNYEQLKALCLNPVKKRNKGNKQSSSLLCILSSLIHSNVSLTEPKIFPSWGSSGSVKTNVLRKTTRTTTMSALPSHDKKKRRKQKATD